ncbi:choice-of-anchor D domain-containing protein [Stigmatella sp. ncwal1]|uniref:Choice-of-anchor D domain-containing protein n=1 Tax=Stigmatella ashevillensis TaxID=2995309 RepID=A0ABT5DIU3_9BACT|nr:choice-of-anchor D domain-containing protein [Stigmatella ashevillena]MDC0713579.1 choice-of-anchor D domain-containing protein [Stigmatella ashevillena]
MSPTARQMLARSDASVTVPTLKWAEAEDKCFTCQNVGKKALCSSETSLWANGLTFRDPLPAGSVLVKIEASVRGLLIDNSPAGPTTVSAFLNDAGSQFGSYSAGLGSCSGTPICRQYEAASTYKEEGFGSSEYVYGGWNTLKLSVPAAANYCVSYVDLKLVYAIPRLVFSRSTVDFGRQKIGGRGDAGDEIVKVYGDPDSGVLLKLGACSTSVPDGGSNPFSVVGTTCVGEEPTPEIPLEIKVRFQPTETGSVTGTLLVDSNDPTHPGSVELTGYGLASAIDVINPGDAGLVFPEQTVGIPSSLDVTLRNVSAEALTVTPSITSDGGVSPFSVAAGGFPVSADGGVLSVTFTPVDGGEAFSTLLLASNQAGDPGVEVLLKGTGVSPKRVMDEGPLEFGEVQLQAYKDLLVTVKAGGTGTLILSGVAVTLADGGVAPYTVDLDGGAHTVPAGSSGLTMNVKFSPTAMGGASGILKFKTNEESDRDVEVPLKGTGVQSQVLVEPSALAFQEQTVNSPRQLPVVVKNPGTGTLSVTNISVLSGDGGVVGTRPYSVLDAGAFQVPAQDGGVLQVQFHPQDGGLYEGILRLKTNAPGQGQVDVRLTGEGVRPLIAVDPSPVAFGEQTVNWERDISVQVRNDGTGKLVVSKIAIDAGTGATPYTVDAQTLEVPKGEAKDIHVRFKPIDGGFVENQLIFTTNKEGTPNTTVLLRGTGVSPKRVMDEGPLEFGEVQLQAYKDLPVTVRAGGTGTLILTGVAVTLADGGVAPYTVDLDGGAHTVPAGSSGLTMNVKFSPTAMGGASGILKFKTNEESDRDVEVPLEGTGVQSQVLVEPSALAFQEQTVNSPRQLPVVVKNPGTGTLSVTNISVLSGDGGVVGTRPYSVLDAGAFQVPAQDGGVLQVQFHPQDGGLYEGILRLKTNAPGQGQVDVRLTGEGVRPLIAVDPSPVAFGEQTVNWERDISVQVRNDGTGKLVVSKIAIDAGTGATPYTVDAQTLEVPKGEAKDIHVRFKPIDGGFVENQLIFTTNKEGTPNTTVLLRGTGVSPKRVMDEGPLEFGEVQLQAYKDLPVTVKAGGTGTLILTGVAVTLADGGVAPYTVDLDGGAHTVPAGSSGLTMNVKFSPTAMGGASGILKFKTNEESDRDVEVPLEGTGVQSQVLVEPSALAFQEQTVNSPRQLPVVVKNPGTGTLSVTNISVLSGDGGVVGTRPYSVLDAGAFQVPAQDGGVLQVQFHPQDGGLYEGILRLKTNAPGQGQVDVRLTGEGVRPLIAVDPSPVAFGEQTVNRGRDISVQVRNDGTGKLVVSKIAIDAGTGVSPYTVDAQTLEVPKGGSRDIHVRFEPTDGGFVENQLIFTTNKEGTPNTTVLLRGTGISPQRVMDGGPLEFGPVRVSSTRSLPVTVKAGGTGTLILTGVAVTLVDGGVAPYTVDLDGGAHNVPAGSGGLTMNVRFSPTAKGDVPGFLKFQTNEESDRNVEVPLVGNGVTLLSANTDGGILEFGPVPKGGKGSIVVSLENTSNLPITLSQPSLSPPFSFEIGSLVINKGTQTFKVHFSPEVDQEFSQQLILESDADNSPLTWELKGRGIVARAHLSHSSSDAGISSYDFGAVRAGDGDGGTGSTVQQTFRLSNTGEAALTISQPPFIPGDGGVFSYLGASGVTIPPGQGFNFEVSFTPKAEQSYSAELVINSNADNSPTKLFLQGVGSSSKLMVSRPDIPFGDVRVGSESAKAPVTITNSGLAPAFIQSIPIQGPFRVMCAPADGGSDGGLGCDLPRQVTSGQPFTFYVSFKPSQPGEVDGGQLTITNDLNASLKVSLTGKGTVASMNVVPSQLTFGSQVVSSDGGSQTVTIYNNGIADLSISRIDFVDKSVFKIDPPEAAPSEGSPLVIGGGTNKTLNVLFVPKNIGPVLEANGMSIVSDAFANATASVGLSGTGIDGQLVMVDAGVISFSEVEVGGSPGQKSVTLQNMGGHRVVIQKVVKPSNAPFDVLGLEGVADGGTVVLNPLESRVVTISFNPQSRGYSVASATIETDAVVSKILNLSMDGTGVGAAMGALPESLKFGRANVGEFATKEFSITNVGERNLNVFDIIIEAAAPDGGSAPDAGADGGSFLAFTLDESDGGSPPFVVRDGGSARVRLKFSPQELGPHTAQAVIQASVKNGQDHWRIPLEGEGTSPSMLLSPDGGVLNCGSTPVDQPSAPVSLTISNSAQSTGTLVVDKVSLAGADSTFFKTSASTKSITLAPGASEQVLVWLEPGGQERAFSAQLMISSNDLSKPNEKVLLFGQGGLSKIDSPARLDFGQQLLRHVSARRMVSIVNNNTSAVTLADVLIQGEGASQFTFARELPRFPHTLYDVSARAADGGVALNQLDLELTFTPVAEKVMPAQLKLRFSSPVLERTVDLLGQGIPSVLSLSPTALEFDVVRAGRSGEAQSKTLTVLNVSSDPIILDELGVQRKVGEPFQIEVPGANGGWPDGGWLEPNKSVPVKVTYDPKVETVSETTLVFGTTTPVDPRAVNVLLKGSATKLVLRVEPGSLEFGRVDMGARQQEPKVVTITNASSSPQLAIVALRDNTGTSFVLDTSELVDAILPEESASFTVNFVPDSVSLVENELEVRLQGESEPEARVRVSGQGRNLTGQGGGCSFGSTEAGSAGVLALLALLVLMSRRRHG